MENNLNQQNTTTVTQQNSATVTQQGTNNTADTKSRKQFIIIVLLLIMAISVGFANLSSTLRIRGTGGISAMQWDVHFENVADSYKDATVIVPATINGNTTNVEYEVQLPVPGSYYEFTVDVVNDGTIDAKLANPATLTGINQEQKLYTNYTVTYSNGSEIKVGDVIRAGESRKIKVRIEIEIDITSELLPKTEQQLDLGVNLDYIQAN